MTGKQYRGQSRGSAPATSPKGTQPSDIRSPEAFKGAGSLDFRVKLKQWAATKHLGKKSSLPENTVREN